PDALKVAQQLVDAGIPEDAVKASQFAGQGLEQLRAGVEHAAESVLGDETAALKRAQGELDKLENQINRELAQATGRDTPDNNRAGSRGSQNRDAQRKSDQGKAQAQGENPRQKGAQEAQQGQEQGKGQQGQPGDRRGRQSGQGGREQDQEKQQGQRKGQGGRQRLQDPEDQRAEQEGRREAGQGEQPGERGN